MWGQALTIDSDNPAGRRWMDGEKTEEEQSSQSRVKSGCHVQASRLGLNQGLCRHHRAQVEGVEGLVSNVPQVVARKVVCLRHVPAFNTWSTAKFFRKRIDGAIPRVSRARGAGTGSAVPESS